MRIKAKNKKVKDFVVTLFAVLGIATVIGLVGSIFAVGGSVEDSKVIVATVPGKGDYANTTITYHYDNEKGTDFLTSLANVTIGGNATDNSCWASLVSHEEQSVLEYGIDANKWSVLSINNGGNMLGDIYVFETDFLWDGFKSEELSDDWVFRFIFVAEALGLNLYFIDGEGDEYYSLSTNHQNTTNDFMLIEKSWYNLRITHTPEDDSYSIYINDKLIEKGKASDYPNLDKNGTLQNTTYGAVNCELRSKYYPNKIIFDNTYLNAISTQEKTTNN